MIADSNLAIYAIGSGNASLEAWFISTVPSMSAISKVEVMGYHRITPTEITRYERFFGNLVVHPIDDIVIDRAISLRQSKSMSLGDAIIAATALVHAMSLGIVY